MRKIKTMVGTTLSTKNTTINHEENKNNGRHYMVLNVVPTIVFIFLTIYSGVLGAQCSVDHCFYFPHDL
jgi:uncharacterized membrane protein